MPRYELMYILSSAVSDDQLPEVTGQILQYATDFGAENLQETQLGKKKLAYPVKKTRNGFYGVLDFSMDGKKINDFDAKIRTQDNIIIRYILVNMNEHYDRLAKDREIQTKMNRNRPAEMVAAGNEAVGATPTASMAPTTQPKKTEPLKEINEADLDKEIEKALTEDITK
jgi:small subunit ribosomal protein S6